ncbi:MAG: hypothetical protein AVDCRST_MAG05-2321, partial [uncultured Rubrobacteraceae bacterium]
GRGGDLRLDQGERHVQNDAADLRALLAVRPRAGRDRPPIRGTLRLRRHQVRAGLRALRKAPAPRGRRAHRRLVPPETRI